jgi:hypothetical protein
VEKKIKRRNLTIDANLIKLGTLRRRKKKFSLSKEHP